jgi:hypothetical protein
MAPIFVSQLSAKMSSREFESIIRDHFWSICALAHILQNGLGDLNACMHSTHFFLQKKLPSSLVKPPQSTKAVKKSGANILFFRFFKNSAEIAARSCLPSCALHFISKVLAAFWATKFGFGRPRHNLRASKLSQAAGSRLKSR